MKRVLNIWQQNEDCIDALLFDENFHIHYIGEKRRKFPYSFHWREKTKISIFIALEKEKCTNRETDKQYIVGSIHI